MAQQIIKGGITPRMGGKVAAHAGQEVVAADISLQLLEHRSTLGIGDAIEVLLHRFDIAGIGGNRVGGRQLILLIGPGFFHIGKGHPRGIVFGFLRLGDGGGPSGEGLVEPQIVPPLHGDQVTEPHMRQFVEDGVCAALILIVRGLGSKDVLIADGDAPGIFHRAGIELWHENLVVFAKGVGETKIAVVEIKALLSLSK